MNKKKMKYSIILGTRPEIIKMSHVIREFEKKRMDYFMLANGNNWNNPFGEREAAVIIGNVVEGIKYG